jgi:hypothetical protein
MMPVIFKRHFWETLFLVFLLVNSVQAKPEIVDLKVLSGATFNTSNIVSVDLFIDKDNNVFVEVVSRGSDFLWLNNNWAKTDQYGKFLNGFVKDGRVHITFLNDEKDIDIYSVEKDITLEKHITLPKSNIWIYQIIVVPGENDVSSSYILSLVDERSSNPIEYMKSWSGHGIFYDKPILAEIQDQTPLKYRKIPYGGKTNESYRIREVLTGKDTIHFLGFRTQKQLGGSEPSTPEVLHYAEYNVKKKKAVRTQDIYEKIPYFDENDKLRHFYWHVSADNFNDDLSIVFSWHGFRYSGNLNNLGIIMENVNSPIYYSQRNGTAFGNVETIGQGILPLVRTDSLGNVHVLWSNNNGDLIHKAKKDGRWCEGQIILNNVININDVWENMRDGTLWLQNMCAEFDKDNNLNVVFQSKGNLVYAKIRAN